MRYIAVAAIAVVLSGCSKTTGAIEGAGFVLETPNALTRDFITKNDRPFANQVAGNRRACERAPACQK